jgi:hypothetical protein
MPSGRRAARRLLQLIKIRKNIDTTRLALALTAIGIAQVRGQFSGALAFRSDPNDEPASTNETWPGGDGSFGRSATQMPELGSKGALRDSRGGQFMSSDVANGAAFHEEIERRLLLLLMRARGLASICVRGLSAQIQKTTSIVCCCRIARMI